MAALPLNFQKLAGWQEILPVHAAEDPAIIGPATGDAENPSITAPVTGDVENHVITAPVITAPVITVPAIDVACDLAERADVSVTKNRREERTATSVHCRSGIAVVDATLITGGSGPTVDLNLVVAVAALAVLVVLVAVASDSCIPIQIKVDVVVLP